MAKNPNVNAANKYARDVVSGRVIACKYIQQACQRHLDDLEKSKEKDYPYRFDAARAERACKFLQLLPHTKGKWRRLPLEPLGNDHWQASLVPPQLFGLGMSIAGMVLGSLLPQWIGHPTPQEDLHAALHHRAAAETHHVPDQPHHH